MGYGSTHEVSLLISIDEYYLNNVQANKNFDKANQGERKANDLYSLLPYPGDWATVPPTRHFWLFSVCKLHEIGGYSLGNRIHFRILYPSLPAYFVSFYVQFTQFLAHQ